ncbi:MAG: pentapeptide repeat-containing protein [Bacteroidales bacterium]|nr:pentapeptide repeat-containing protein [Bacteroidales bacterium]
MKLIHSILAILVALMVVQGCGGRKYQPPKEGDILAAEQIVEMLRSGRPLYVKGCTIKGSLDFTEVSGSSNLIAVAPSYVDADIVFSGCTFEDSVTTFAEYDNKQRVYTVFEKNLVFHDCEFKKGINFTQADFRGRFDFDLSKVAGDAAFDGCTFRNGTSFVMANFNGDASFVSTEFGGRINFMKSFFRKSAIFQRCKMGNAAMFADSHFYGYTEFSKITALGDMDYTNSQFLDRAFFIRSLYMGNIKFANCVFKEKLSFTGNTLSAQPVTPDIKLPSCGVEAADNVVLQKSIIDCFK